MITAGIDCGAKSIKAVIIKDGKIVGRGSRLAGFDREQGVDAALELAIRSAGIDRLAIQRIVGTGSGVSAVFMADEAVGDIPAMAKGAHYYFPRARTVADVGAEEGRAAKLDASGDPVDFAVNEKCAAGAGAFVEAMARALDLSIEEMAGLYQQSDREIPINAQCVVFAESEVVGLIHAGTAKADIIKAVYDGIADRIGSMIRLIGANQDIVMLGGLGNSAAFRAALRTELKIEKIYVPEAPEFGSATGAAVMAAEGR